MSPFRRSIVISVLFHAALLICLFFLLKAKMKKPRPPMMATLVSPEEVLKPALPPVRHILKRPRMMRRRLPTVRPYRMRPIPPPTEKELRHMPLWGVPRQGGPKGPKAKSRHSSVLQKPKTHPPKGPGRAIGRRQLFDQGVITAESKRILAANERSGGGNLNAHAKPGSITFSTSDMKYWGYMQRLKQKIESVWIYPPSAVRRGLYGELEIRFTILKDGSLGDVTVVTTSGYPVLDQAALKALRDSQPYWPLPDAWGVKSFTVDGHFLYTNLGHGIE